MNNKSLEDTIRSVSQKYRNRPSPLKFLDPEKQVPMTPQQVTPKTDMRAALMDGFKPQNYRIF